MVSKSITVIGLVLVLVSVGLQFASFFYQTGFISGYKLSIYDQTGAIVTGAVSQTGMFITIALISGIVGTIFILKGFYKKF